MSSLPHSAAECLGPVWGVHIWHDNSGPSPDWYLTQVEVSEVIKKYYNKNCLWTHLFIDKWTFKAVWLVIQVLRGHVVGCSWLFVAQCWLAASKGDGRVERMLRVCTQGINFAQVQHSCSHKNSFRLLYLHARHRHSELIYTRRKT